MVILMKEIAIVEDEVELAVAIEALRNELKSARENTANKPIRLEVSELTIAFQAALKSVNDISSAVSWYALNARGAQSSSTEFAQSLHRALWRRSNPASINKIANPPH